jgi:4-carboxymuconolactone decarboxylase
MPGRRRAAENLVERAPRARSVAGRVSRGCRRTPLAQKGESTLDYTERLRCLAINDARLAEDGVGAAWVEAEALDPKTLALVRLAALVAVGGAVPSFGAQADAALSAGATAAEIVEVLIGVIPVVGLPRVVAAAPRLAMALGYDADDALEPQSGG